MPTRYVRTFSDTDRWDTSQAWSAMLGRSLEETRKKAFALRMRNFKPTFIKGDTLFYDGFLYVAENDSYIVEDNSEELVDVRSLDEHAELIRRNKVRIFRLYKKSPLRKTGLTMFLEKTS